MVRHLVCLATVAGLAFAAAAQDQYVRVTFRKSCGWLLQLSELAVYTGDAENGYTRVNLGLMLASSTDETKLGYGQYLFKRNGTTTSVAKTDHEGSDKLFDGDGGTKMCNGNPGFLSESDAATNPSKWALLTMKLAEGTATPTAYNFRNGGDYWDQRSPTHWTVELSHDGVNWYTFDEQLPGSVPGNSQWYNGGESKPYAFPLPLVVFEPIPNQRLNPAGCCPGVTITDFETGQTLVENKDYTLAYENNKAPGTATVIVTGVPGTAYEQLSRTRTFEIFPVTMRVTVEAPVEFGSPLSFTVVDPVGEVPLEEGVHYTYATAGLGRCGSAAVIVRGVEDTPYAGVAVTNVFVVSKGGQMTGVTIGSPSDFIVAEMPVTAVGQLPEPEVRGTAGELLEKDVDYALSYSGGSSVGFATVTVTGLAPQAGTQTVKFYQTSACNADLVGVGTDTNQYVRVTFRQAGISGLLELSELAVYAPNPGGGLERVNLNLATKTTTSVSTLTPGSYIYVRNPGNPSSIAGTGGETSDKLFDGNGGSKLCGTSPGSASKDTPANWLQLTMLLPTGTARPIAYNFRSGGDSQGGGRLPNYWTVEVSHDGTNFGFVDEQLPGTNPGANSTWFNGGGTGAADAKPYPFAKRAVKMEPIPNQRLAPGGCTPALTLVDMDTGHALAKDVDYTVEFLDNGASGTATAVITGAEGSPYAGYSHNETFQIFGVEWTVAAADVDPVEGGSAVPRLTVVDPYDDRTLVEGADYTVEGAGLDRCGSAAVIVRGVPGTFYQDLVSTNFFLVRRSGSAVRLTIAEPSDFIVAELPDVVFGGEAVEPKPVVRSAAGDLLEENIHYTLAYEGCGAIGPATVTVTGIAPHAGRQVASFNLSGALFVTPEATGGKSGAGWDAAMTLAEAVAAAAAGDIILLKEGVYSNASLTVNRTLTLRGGYAGDETLAMPPQGTGRSVLDGCATNDSTGVATVLSVSASSNADIRFERIEVRRALTHGVSVSMGAGRVTFDGCRFYDNGYQKVGVNGRGVYASGNGSSVLVFENCDFTENRYKYNTGGYQQAVSGQALYLSSVGRTELTGTLFLRNGLVPSTGWRAAFGRSSGHGFCLYASDSPLTVTDCDFVANIGLLHQQPYSDGGVIWLNGASASSFVSCRFLGNTTTSFEDNSSPKGGATFTLNTTAGSLTTFDLCTFAYNISVGTVGTGYTQISGDALIRNSIFYANAVRHASVGCADIYVHGGACTVENCRLSAADSSSYRKAAGATLNLPEAVETRDPLFALSEAEFLATYVKGGKITGTDAYQPWTDAAMDLFGRLDCHLKSEAGRWTGADWAEDDVTSPFIDAATAGTPYANETDPDGGAANLGGYGNTEEASRTPIAAPTLGAVDEDQEGDVGTVIYRVTTGGEGPYLANVYFCRGAANPGGTGTNGWDEVRTVAKGVSRGAPIEIPLGEYVEKGTSWHWRIVIEASGGTASVDGQTTAEHDLPPYKNRGGPANVLHVWGEAGGRGDGSDWWNAFRTPEEAFAAVSATKSEIWIIGDVGSAGAGGISLSYPCTVRGGFTTNAFETAAEERPADTFSRLVATNANVLLTGTVSASLTCERVRFERATNYGVSLTATAPVVFRDCAFTDTRTTGGTIHALGVVSSPSVTVERCRFTGNWSTSTLTQTTSMEGAALYLSGCKKTTVSDCLFATNGIAPTVLNWAAARDEDKTGLSVHIVDSPAFFTNCVFAANRATAHSSAQRHATVYLGGSSGGSVFSHCRFVANAFANWSDTSLGDSRSAPVVVTCGSAANPVVFDFCTFAYNVYNNNAGCAGLLVSGGAVTVRNSIFFGNFRTANATANLMVVDSATVQVAYTLFDATNRLNVTEGTPGAISWGEGIVLGDPLFGTRFETFRADVNGSTAGTNLVSGGAATRPLGAIDPCAINLHVASISGYIDEQTGRPAAVRGGRSPAINAGDPADRRWALEPKPNGKRVNLGAYGGTPWAEKTPTGGALILR